LGIVWGRSVYGIVVVILALLLPPISIFTDVAYFFNNVVSNYNKYTKETELRDKQQKEEIPKKSILEATSSTANDTEIGSDRFRGIKWGTDIEEFPDMRFIFEDKGQTFYQKMNENLKIDHVNVDKIIYSFCRNKFCSIGIEYSSISNFQKMKDFISTHYGEFNKKEDSEDTRIKYFWSKNNVGVVLDFNLQSQKGTAAAMYMPLFDESEDQTKATARQQFPQDETSAIEIIAVDMKVIKHYTDWVKCSWLVKIRNNDNNQRKVRITIEFLDKDGFKVDATYESAILKPNQINSITGGCPPFSNDEFSQIHTINARVKEY